MKLTNLISAFEAYIDIKKRKGDLTDVHPEDILDQNNNRKPRFRMAVCTSQDKEEFDQAKQTVEDILNSHIDQRVKTVIKSMKNSGEL